MNYEVSFYKKTPRNYMDSIESFVSIDMIDSAI